LENRTGVKARQTGSGSKRFTHLDRFFVLEESRREIVQIHFFIVEQTFMKVIGPCQWNEDAITKLSL
jgi:hypothetical protein